MPYFRSKIKTLSLGEGLTVTIPQIFLYSTDNLYRQIIDENLYIFLLSEDIDWTLLSSGDFLIMAPSAVEEVEEIIREWYGLPPVPSCQGKTRLVTFSNSSFSHLKGIFEASNSNEIISVCFGRTILESFISNDQQILTGQINTELSTEIL